MFLNMDPGNFNILEPVQFALISSRLKPHKTHILPFELLVLAGSTPILAG